jgi:hypothetical protein
MVLIGVVHDSVNYPTVSAGSGRGSRDRGMDRSMIDDEADVDGHRRFKDQGCVQIQQGNHPSL